MGGQEENSTTPITTDQKRRRRWSVCVAGALADEVHPPPSSITVSLLSSSDLVGCDRIKICVNVPLLRE